MSRDFIGTTVGRAFRQSPNRDRITRAGTPQTDWLAKFSFRGNAVLIDGSSGLPSAPAGFVFEDLRHSITGNTTTALFPSLPDVFAYGIDQNVGVGTGSFLATNVFQDAGRLFSRLPQAYIIGSSQLYRIQLRCWGIANLSDAFGFDSAPSFVTRLGSKTDPQDYPPPEFTIYEKRPLIVFNFGDANYESVGLITSDFEAFGGIPVNAYSLIPGAQAETKKLFDFDRLITATVSTRITAGHNPEQATIAAHSYASPTLEGAVLQTDFQNGTQHSRTLYQNIREPNGTLLNPANPIIVTGTVFPYPQEGLNIFGVGPFGTALTPSILYRSAGISVSMETLIPIASYEPPTMTILRQDQIA